MKSNYKKLSAYIRESNVRNSDGSITNLLGVNIDKYFMPSVANIVGTDLTVYKVVKTGQFACNRMHVGRDKRLPIALSNSDSEFIVSPAYDVFEIVDETILNPEYLMMWFSRKEFDRNAWFYTDADVRGGLSWDAFCNMQLPVPAIEKQKEIVKEYHIIVNLIKLNEQLNQKLEETAQAIYKQWFVDFEFPDEEGRPYKSSGGFMINNPEFRIDVPVGWDVITLGDLINYKKGFAFKSEEYCSEGARVVRVSNFTKNSIDIRDCYFVNNDALNNYSQYVLKVNDIVISTVGSWPNNPDSIVGKVIKVPLLADNSLLNQNAVRLQAIEDVAQLFLYHTLNRKEFSEYVISGAQGSANQASVTLEHIFSFKIVYPNLKCRDTLFPHLIKLNESWELRHKETHYLYEMHNIILQKMATE